MGYVRVIVGGHCSSGKTTVAVVIEKALREAGFKVEPFTNPDGDAQAKRVWLSEGKLAEFISNTEVVLEEKQLPRSMDIRSSK